MSHTNGSSSESQSPTAKSRLYDRIGAYTTVPNSIIRMWPDIGVDGMALFLYLRYRTNSETEIAFPGYDTIVKETRLTRRRIAQAIRALEKAGVLERKRRFSASTLYILKLPGGNGSTPISPGGGRMGSRPTVQQVDSISPTGGLPLVQGEHTIKKESIKTQFNVAVAAPVQIGSRGRSAASVNSVDSKPPHFKESLVVLSLIGVGEPKASEIAALTHATPKFIDAHARAWMQQRSVREIRPGLGVLIRRIEGGERVPPPEGPLTDAEKRRLALATAGYRSPE